jgi:hypothetical protein
MDVFSPQYIQQGGGKFALSQYFTPGKSNAAPGFLIKRPVLKADFQGFFYIIRPGIRFPAFVISHDTNLHLLRFRIGTPPAGKGTAFEKNDCSDAGAIVEAEFLDIKKKAGKRHILTIY